MSIHLIVLAAGSGSRMESDLPKVLHEIAGAPMITHALGVADSLETGERVVVVGHGGDKVRETVVNLDEDIRVVEQTEQLGTAHAVTMAAPALEGETGDAVVLYGDTPFIRPETLNAMSEARKSGADIAILGFQAADPGRYGRLVTEGSALLKIVEWKDATATERAISLCNSGVIMADVTTLLRLASSVGNENAAREYYLTDIVELGRVEGLTAGVVTCPEAETLGINTRTDLAAAEAVFQANARMEAMVNGVTLVAPDSVYFSYDTHIGRDAVVEQNVVFAPGVTVESGSRIRAFSHLEGAHVGAGAIVGPYARLRPGTELSNDAKVGNFVEVKNAVIGDGAKINHLSYIGDAEIGAKANVGAGTVTCNYDGVFKHRTTIGERAFIGSNTMLVAPVTVGNEAMTATGTIVTRDVPEGDMAIGRPRQENKSGLARRLFKKLRAAKAAVKKG
ncbi:MAG: bifunctional UDP-N-acetylglucosamine diphosphorylase/glucosamine-1-phosphate N-acetyltransferase GlmU [Boseongicola sp.]|nr:bifunctional UDP-N-acetylglucosamine diphosphorylase/glucosamine-1-phosphate N-acetyltransferase GlmU [Boseongicola sp.]